METEHIGYPEIQRRLGGVSQVTIRNWIAKGLFPPPFRLAGMRLARWERATVEDWLRTQATKRADRPQMAAVSA